MWARSLHAEGMETEAARLLHDPLPGQIRLLETLTGAPLRGRYTATKSTLAGCRRTAPFRNLSASRNRGLDYSLWGSWPDIVEKRRDNIGIIFPCRLVKFSTSAVGK